MTDTYDFGHAVFTIEGENRQFIETLKQSETATTQTMSKMTGATQGLQKSGIGATQAFSLLGPTVGAIGGKFSSILGPLVGVGSAIAGIGTALLTLPVMLFAAAAAAGYAAYKFATFGGALKDANERIDARKAKLKAQEAGIKASVKAIENQMAIMRGAAPSSLIQQEPVKRAMAAKELLEAELKREQAAEAIESATIGRINALDRELMIAQGLRDQYDYITDSTELRLALEIKHVNLAKEEKRIREDIAKAEQQRIAGGNVTTAGEAMVYLMQQMKAEAARRESAAIVERMARMMTMALGPAAGDMLSKFISSPAASAASAAEPAAPSYGFGLASQHRWSNITRPAIGVTADMSKTKSVEKQLELLIQQGLSGRGIKVQAAGMN